MVVSQSPLWAVSAQNGDCGELLVACDNVAVDRRKFLQGGLVVGAGAALAACGDEAVSPGLWSVYDQHFSNAKYVSMSHVLEPTTPIWYGFDPTRLSFSPAKSGNATVKPVGQPYTYADDGFEATEYVLPTDQYGTQLDPPAHWNPIYPAIDELTDTLALRPLAVISIVPQVQRDFGYALTVDDIQQWERDHGRVPAGSVVMVRSDWHKGWNDPAFVARTPFPGVSLAALKFLHLERQILFHGHEPLDTDSTPTLEGESWLLNNGYLQAEGVANLDQVPETGALITIGFPKFKGGTGGLASFVAICPKDWPHGERRGDRPDAPFDKFEQPLAWDAATGTRTRTSG
jgi:kynurenine formamidase